MSRLFLAVPKREESRTVSLSDLFDDSLHSSTWLQDSSETGAARQQAAAKDSKRRADLCALLSLSSTSDIGTCSREPSASGAELIHSNLLAHGIAANDAERTVIHADSGQWHDNLVSASHAAQLSSHVQRALSPLPDEHQGLKIQAEEAAVEGNHGQDCLPSPRSENTQRLKLLQRADQFATPAAAVAPAQPPAKTATGAKLQQEKVITERKLVKCLKKLQQDKQRLNGQVQQLLESQAKLLQTVQAAPRPSLGQEQHTWQLQPLGDLPQPPALLMQQQQQQQQQWVQQQQQWLQPNQPNSHLHGQQAQLDSGCSSSHQQLPLSEACEQHHSSFKSSAPAGSNTPPHLKLHLGQASAAYSTLQQQQQEPMQQQEQQQEQQQHHSAPGTGYVAHTDLASSGQDRVAVAPGPIPAEAVNSSSSSGAEAGCLQPEGLHDHYHAQQQLLQQQVQEQKIALEDQAEAIKELKAVIAELEIQTNRLRARAAKADSGSEALAECQANLAARSKQLQEANEELEKLRELAQAAVREALRTSREAEAQRDALRVQLQQQQAAAAALEQDAAQARQQAEEQAATDAAEQHAAADAELTMLRGEKEQLAAQVAKLQLERKQLLHHLQDANNQITELHDELGPALYKGPTSPGRISRLSAISPAAAAATGGPAAAAAAAAAPAYGSAPAAEAGGGLSNVQYAAASGVGPQLTAALGNLTSQTEQLKVANKEAKAAAAAAEHQKTLMQAELDELQDAYKELQQKHGKLQAAHKVLREEHSQLLSRQVGVASERSSLRQQFVTLEEQYLQAKMQVAELQAENWRLKSLPTAAAGAAAAEEGSTADGAAGEHVNSKAVAAAAAPTAEEQQATSAALKLAQEQAQLMKQQLLSLAADNARLAVAVAESLIQQQQRGEPAASAPVAADVGVPGVASDTIQQQQQRLQLLLSQLIIVRDQAAAAAELSEKQGNKIQEQRKQLVQLSQQLADLQQEYAALKGQQLAAKHSRAKTALTARAAAGEAGTNGAGSAAVGAASMLLTMQENLQLELELADSCAAVRQLAAEREVLLSGLVDRQAVEELHARNRGLLQEITRLLDETAELQSRLDAAQATAAAAQRAAAAAAASAAVRGGQQQQQQLIQLGRSTSLKNATHVREPSFAQSSSSSHLAANNGSIGAFAAEDNAAAAGSLREPVDVTREDGEGATAAAAAAAAASVARALAKRSKSFQQGSGGNNKVSWSRQLSVVSPTPAAPEDEAPENDMMPILSPTTAAAVAAAEQMLAVQNAFQRPSSAGVQYNSPPAPVSAAVPAAVAAAQGPVQPSGVAAAVPFNRSLSYTAAAQPSSPATQPPAATAVAELQQPRVSDAAALIAAVLQRSRSRSRAAFIDESGAGAPAAAAEVQVTTGVVEQQQQQRGSLLVGAPAQSLASGGQAAAAAVGMSRLGLEAENSSSRASKAAHDVASLLLQQQQQSRIPAVDTIFGGGGSAAAARAAAAADSQGARGAMQSQEELQQPPSPFAAAQAQQPLAADNSVNAVPAAAAAAAGDDSRRSQRSALVSAILQRQQSQHASRASVAAGSALPGASANASFAGLSKSTSFAAPADRAALVAAVLQRHKQQQQQEMLSLSGGTAAATPLSRSSQLAEVSYSGGLQQPQQQQQQQRPSSSSLFGGGSNAGSSVAGSSVAGSRDRASLVAAVLAKHKVAPR